MNQKSQTQSTPSRVQQLLRNPEVHATTAYSIFKKIKGNRKIDKFHVYRLTKSIIKNNLLEQNPIVVNSEMGILDGQHRLEVAKANGLVIYYMVAPEGTLETVQTLNSAIRPWQMKDYLDSYMALGKGEYLKLKTYCEVTGFSLSNALMILGGKGDDLNPQGLRNEFKAGNFVVTNQEMADKLLEILPDLKEMCETREWQDRDLLRATAKVMTQTDFSLMVEQQQKSNMKIKRQISVRDYLRQYEDIVNYNKKVRIRFY